MKGSEKMNSESQNEKLINDLIDELADKIGYRYFHKGYPMKVIDVIRTDDAERLRYMIKVAYKRHKTLSESHK